MHSSDIDLENNLESKNLLEQKKSFKKFWKINRTFFSQSSKRMVIDAYILPCEMEREKVIYKYTYLKHVAYIDFFIRTY